MALRLTDGMASRATLDRLCGRDAVRSAAEAGLIRRTGHGTYALPSVDDALALAHATSGTLCLASAAIRLGWPVREAPTRAQICYPRNRKVPQHWRRVIDVRRADLVPGDRAHGATSPAKTLEMCARSLGFADALSIADSALRAGFEPDLRSIRHARGRGAARIRRVVELAHAGAANPFESTLRAIALDVPGLAVRPQVWIGNDRPDLVDEDLRLILEADSYEWHGGRSALHRDANRYNAFVSAGWTVLRFSWEEVMLHPDRVHAVLDATGRRLNVQKSA